MTTDLASLARDWPRVKWTRAAQVAPLMGDDAPGMATVADLPPSAAFTQLRDTDPMGAARFMAQCLPRVDAARWVEQCLLDAVRTPPTAASSTSAPTVSVTLPPARAAAAKAVRRWVATPSDEARRLAFAAGGVAGWGTMEGMACLALYLSGGSLAPAGQEVPVNPPPGAFGQAAAGAVLLAASGAGVPAFAATLQAMLDIAEAIAARDQPG